jgi:elongator complex protein 2
MPEESIRRTFISIGCNRTPNAADSSRKSGRTAFGAHNTVALWDPAVRHSFLFSLKLTIQETTSRGIYATLKGHTDIVNVVRWVPGCEDGKEVIVSGSVDRSVRIWKEIDGEVNCLR